MTIVLDFSERHASMSRTDYAIRLLNRAKEIATPGEPTLVNGNVLGKDITAIEKKLGIVPFKANRISNGVYVEYIIPYDVTFKN